MSIICQHPSLTEKGTTRKVNNFRAKNPFKRFSSRGTNNAGELAKT